MCPETGNVCIEAARLRETNCTLWGDDSNKKAPLTRANIVFYRTPDFCRLLKTFIRQQQQQELVVALEFSNEPGNRTARIVRSPKHH